MRNLLFLLFFVSGFSGLIYESLWSHYLKLFLGHAAYAQSLVLMIFMGGMALGAALVGRYSLRARNLLAAYALMEIGIGILAFAFHPAFVRLVDLSFLHVIPALGSAMAIEAYKWLLALLLLLPPSILLGTTFPLMSGAILRRFPGADGRHLATLYFSNSLGAAAGVLAASFLLIGALGLPGTLTLAGGINLLVGACAWYVSRLPERHAQAARPESAPADRRLLTLLLAAAFVTGAASFIYEVVWIRMLSLVLGSTFHAFELMLSAFITGLALGSLAIRRYMDRIADPLKFGALVQLGMGVLAVATLPVYAQAFTWMAGLVHTLPRDPQGYLLFNLASHAIAFAVMLPATFLAGMTLPLFTHALIRNGHGEGSIGRIYAANTLGAIAGVLFTVHVAMPVLGLKLALASGAVLDILLGLLILRFTPLPAVARLAALAVLLVPVAMVRLVDLGGAMLGSGVYRTGTAEIPDAVPIFYRDGKTASINVSRIDSTLVIRTNGKPDAAIQMDPRRPASSDEITMVMAAAVPLAIRPDARRVANIGFGSGLTTHTLLADPALEEVATIEIERAMVEGAQAFLPRVARAYQDPRSRIYIDDAKSWFAQQDRTFDIIVSEPSNPWVSGVSSLFSDEFYRRVRDYLDDRGLLVQWLNLYEFNTELSASVMTALRQHFSDYAVYLTDDSNMLIVAMKQGSLPPLSEEIFRLGGMRAELQRVGIVSMDDLALRRLGSASTLDPMLAMLQVPRNSDYAPYVELNAPRARFLREQAVEFPLLGVDALPMIEMLEAPKAAWQAQRLAPVTSLRYRKVSEALAIRDALLGQTVDAAVAGKVAAWRAQLQDCAAPERGQAALQAVAETTLAFLDREAAQAMWAQSGWMGCAARSDRLSLYRAVAKRDAPAMLQTAQAALASGDNEQAWRRYALQVGLLAARARQDKSAAEALWSAHGAGLYAGVGIPAPLLLLLSYPQPAHKGDAG